MHEIIFHAPTLIFFIDPSRIKSPGVSTGRFCYFSNPERNYFGFVEIGRSSITRPAATRHTIPETMNAGR
jgi:hypothetical protein